MTKPITEDNRKVCVNEICEHYCRATCMKFQEHFKHCPYCGARLVTQDMAMYLLKNNQNDKANQL